MIRASFFLQRNPKSGVIYYRRVIPQEFRPAFNGKFEIKRSLHTFDRQIAFDRAIVINSAFNKIIQTFQGVHGMDDSGNIGKIVIGDVVIDFNGDVDKELKALENIKPLLEQRQKENPPQQPVTVQQSNFVDNCEPIKLVDACRKYRDEKVREGSWREKTCFEHEASHTLLIQFFGNRLMSSVTNSDGRKLKDALLCLPSNLSKGDNAKLTLKQLLGMKHERVMTTKTINDNYLQRYSSLFDWGVRQGYCAINPFAGLKMRLKRNVQDERHPFSEEELVRIFSPGIFNRSDLDNAQYWIPIIGLYSGARLQEISDLRPQDIILENGIYCIDICEDSGHVKTASSNRVVPIHPRLIELGFLDIVNQAREAGQDRIFQELYRTKRIKSGEVLGRWFNRTHLKIAGLLPRPEGRKISFHSFRHAFIDRLNKAGVPEHLAAQITGHKHSQITYGRYGSKSTVAELFEVVKVVTFDVI